MRLWFLVLGKFIVGPRPSVRDVLTGQERLNVDSEQLSRRAVGRGYVWMGWAAEGAQYRWLC